MSRVQRLQLASLCTSTIGDLAKVGSRSYVSEENVILILYA